MRFQLGIVGLFCLSLAHATTPVENNSIRIIVKYKQPSSIDAIKVKVNKLPALSLKAIKPIAGGAYVLTINRLKANTNDADPTTTVLNQLRRDSNVMYALKDRIGHFYPLPKAPLNETPNLLSHESQWSHFLPPAGIKLETAAGLRDGAWSYSTGKALKRIVVAVLDTGISTNSSLMDSFVKDEQGKVWGWNFATDNMSMHGNMHADLYDETRSFHGSHVAGIIAGYGDVMIGVGEHLKILPVKVVDKSGMFYESQVINAIYWSVGAKVPNVPLNPFPAKVLNMSFGVDERPGKEVEHCDEALQEAMFYVRSKGAVVTVAAGNDNHWELYNAPAVCNHAIKVASTGPEGLRAYYSNYGPSISFAAPGGDLHYGTPGGILSTVNPGGGYQNSGYDFYQGTSMASPHAAGVAGLIYAVTEGAVAPERVEQILYATTHAFGVSETSNNSCTGKKPCGHGILDAENAVKAALSDFDLIFTAPSMAELVNNVNSRNLHSKLKSGELVANWLPTKSISPSLNYTEPTLENKADKIIANYGKVTYYLDTSAFKHCQIIGVNGLGCYR